MARPVALATGVYHLNVRVPSDLAGKVRGTRVSLPINGVPTSVKIGDNVTISLRTKDAKAARARFSLAEAALSPLPAKPTAAAWRASMRSSSPSIDSGAEGD